MSSPIESASTLQPGGYRDILPADAAAHLGAFRIIDVREPAEYTSTDMGRIEGAELFPLGGVTQAAASWDRDQPLLLICRSGKRSISAALALLKMGFTQPYNLAGGMMAWNTSSLPVKRGP